MYGNNDIKSSEDIAILRAQYQTSAHPENGGAGSAVIKDLNIAEFNYYGRVDTMMTPITPIGSKMVGMTLASAIDTSQQFRVLPFVRDMYEEMRLNINLKIQAGIFRPERRSIGLLEPVRAFESPFDKYSEYLRYKLQLFNTKFLSTNDKKNITSFDSYVKYLMIYLSRIPPSLLYLMHKQYS